MKLNFIEALDQLTNGHKIKYSDWEDGSYIFLKKLGSVWVWWNISKTEELFPMPLDIVEKEWEIIEEPHDVLWALEQMKSLLGAYSGGKKLKKI